MSKSNNSKQLLYVLLVLATIAAIGLYLTKDASSKRENLTPYGVFKQKSNQEYQMTVYYFPSSKNAATALTFYFTEHGYPVQMQPATVIPALNASKKTPSHLFYHQEDFAKAMEIKKLIEKVLGYPVNAYRFREYLSDDSMMMVFTEARDTDS